jgi:hypothetical protein
MGSISAMFPSCNLQSDGDLLKRCSRLPVPSEIIVLQPVGISLLVDDLKGFGIFSEVRYKGEHVLEDLTFEGDGLHVVSHQCDGSREHSRLASSVTLTHPSKSVASPFFQSLP